MFLLIGLGNPGASHAANRHNAGFMAVDAIAEKHGFPVWQARHRGAMARGMIGTQDVFLLKPATFMNLSGASVGEAARFYKIPLENIFVFHDELDLALGKVRVKRGGGSAGHNGLKSLDAHLEKDYWRVRIGIGHPGAPELVSDYVLSDFRAEERKEMKPVIAAIAAAAPRLLEAQPERFMTDVARERRP